MPTQDTSNRKGIIAFQSELRKELVDGDGHSFGQKASIYKQTIQDIDSTLKNDRKHLKETLTALSDMLKAANLYIEADKAFADHLETMGTNSLTTGSQHPCIGNALIKLALLFKDLSSLMKIKIKAINDSLIGPLKTFIDQGTQKDLRDTFEKTWKNYDAVMNKKQKNSVDHLEGGDAFEDISESKRKAKLDVCDFMIKFNDISSKTGADFVTQLISLYDNEYNYFGNGKSCLNNLETYMSNLKTDLADLKANQEADKNALQEIRDKLRPKPETLTTAENRQREAYSLTQAADSSFGLNLIGPLNKRTEGIHRWQKRWCKVENFKFSISHNQSSSATATLPLLTCQVKETPSSAVDGKKHCFHLISYNRTYHFEAANEMTMKSWTTVIRNNIDQAIKAAVGPSAIEESQLNTDELKMRDFIKKIISKIKKTPGNDKCVDCRRPGPEWFAVNLGVMVCIHCSGAHRKLGSHNSRIRSLDLDNPVTAELLLLYKIGNAQYNEVFRADVRPSNDIPPDSSLEERHAHIRAKHEERKYVKKKCMSAEERVQCLHRCVESQDIRGLLQVHGEGVKLGSPIPNSLYEETALHIAVTKEDESSLHIVDFLAQNCQGDEINKQDADGRSALHIAVINNKPQSIKILLRGNANPRTTDNAGETPLDLIKEDQEECKQLLELAMNGKHLARCDVVNFNWGIEGQPDFSSCELDYTDDELDTETASPEKAARTKRSIEHSQRTPGFSGSNTLALAAAQMAANKKSFDASAGGLVYNSSPRSSFSSHNQPTTPRTTLPAQSPYRNSGNPGNASSRNSNPGNTPPMNLPPNIAPMSSPVSSRTRKSVSTATPGNRKTSASKGATNRTSTSSKHRISGHNIAGSRGHSSVQRNRSFTMEQVPGPGRAGSRSEVLEERLLRSCSVSVTNNKSDRNYSGTPPVPHREPPALPPRSQRRRVQAVYDCEADDIDELSFKRGDIILVVEEIDESWWFGMIDGDDNRKGIFPKNFIRQYVPPP